MPSDFTYVNTTNSTLRVIIEPIFDQFYLDKNEKVVISVNDDRPMVIDVEDVDENNCLVLCLDSHFFYNREIKKQKN